MYRIATAKEVREMHKASGNTVRISKDGHIEFKKNGEGKWLEGRWVSEHVMTDVGVQLR